LHFEEYGNVVHSFLVDKDGYLLLPFIYVECKGEVRRPKASGYLYDYFKDNLGVAPSDDTLVSLPCDSQCGRDCIKVIDAAVALLAVCDKHPDVVENIMAGVNAAVEVYWRG
jgi:hypothetical protein